VREAVRAGRRWRFGVLLAGCVLLAVGLRMPFLHAPLGIDEGGDAYIARQWGTGHGGLYGSLWLDRPPGLLLLLKAALLDGAVGIRILGAVAAVTVVLAVAWTARVLAGERAGLLAALLAAVFTGSFALAGVFTTGELLAAAPSALSVGALVTAHRRGGAGWMAAAGALAVCALLVKQSFADAGAAGAIFLVASAVLRRREAWRWIAAYAAGALLPLGAVGAWLALSGIAPGRLVFATFGFRVEALRTLAASSLPLQDRVRALLRPAIRSALVFALPVALAGLLRLGRDRVLAVTFAAWLAAGLVGVLGGGSYWPHYLLQLVPVVSVLAAVALARARVLVSAPIAAGVAGLAIAVSISGAAGAIHHPRHGTELAVARYLHRHARPGDTLYVMYARANLLYDAGLPTPYPYAWSLMVRALPDAPARLRHLLASPRRPTWIVGWQRPDRWGLDPHGSTRRLRWTWYRPVARVRGRVVYHVRSRPRVDRGRGGARARAPARGARRHAEGEAAAVRDRGAL
jgi:4-amino-4-deoxy-L-arabinose transferase-like glycosyltransferase